MRIELVGEDGAVQTIEVASERARQRKTTTEVTAMATKKKPQGSAETTSRKPEASSPDDEVGEGGGDDDGDEAPTPQNGTPKRPKPSGVGRVVYHFEQVAGLMTLANRLTTRWLKDLPPGPETVQAKTLAHLAVKSAEVKIVAEAALVTVRALAETGWMPPEPGPRSLSAGDEARLADEHAKTYEGAKISATEKLTVGGDGPVRGMVWVTKADGSQAMVARGHLVRTGRAPATTATT